jgi:hypothetical protein
MTDRLTGLKTPLKLAAGLLALVGLLLLFKYGVGVNAVVCFIGAAAALFAAWATTAPPPREREGMLDGVIDDHVRRKGEQLEDFELRKTRRRLGLDD